MNDMANEVNFEVLGNDMVFEEAGCRIYSSKNFLLSGLEAMNFSFISRTSHYRDLH